MLLIKENNKPERSNLVENQQEVLQLSMQVSCKENVNKYSNTLDNFYFFNFIL